MGLSEQLGMSAFADSGRSINWKFGTLTGSFRPEAAGAAKCLSNPHHIVIHPVVIRPAEAKKTTGHNLNGVNLILNPVKNDTTAISSRKPAEIMYVAVDVVLIGSIMVTVAIRMPTKISAIPSTIHSIRTMFLLSWLIDPKPRTTDFVGKRCATPQISASREPRKINAIPIALPGYLTFHAV